ncbi:uncharacterized protein METZ01_LOCUS479162, partial [marine metagenome]
QALAEPCRCWKKAIFLKKAMRFMQGVY